MANRSKNPTWASVQAELQQMDPKALVNLVRDIYRSSPENRRFLHARLLGSKTELAKYRKLVIDAIYPEPFSRLPVRVSEAERLIRHYRQAASDIESTVDLMLSFVEAGTEQAADAETQEVLRAAKSERNHELRLKAIGRAEKQLELEGKLLGELNENAPAQINVAVLAPMILQALEPFPNARLSVAKRLKEMDQ